MSPCGPPTSTEGVNLRPGTPEPTSRKNRALVAAGARLVGEFHYTRAELVATLGEPGTPLDELKTREEWVFSDYDGVVVYDYRTKVPLPELTVWHVGAKSRYAAERFAADHGLRLA